MTKSYGVLKPGKYRYAHCSIGIEFI